MPAVEVNFDGLIGPTHNFAGLAWGNLRSQENINKVSHPRRAALQGLEKMKSLVDLGMKQAVLPPQLRPDVAALRRLGFAGNDSQVLESAAKTDPRLLAACGSASAMWTANAATVSPSADCSDGRLHFTPANLITLFHRSLEAPTTNRVLRQIFPDESVFAHHPPLPAAQLFSDEGAANHIRLSPGIGERGLEIFVYGKDAASGEMPRKFPARQSRHACEAISRAHGLRDCLFVRQNPDAIDAGAFHNDVVAVGNLNVLLYHASAWVDGPRVIEDIRRWFGSWEFHAIEISEKDLPLTEAVNSYLFNSQLVQVGDSMELIAPSEARNSPAAFACVQQILKRGPIRNVRFVDVPESMNNGGGPACLRLRVVLNEKELAAVRPGVLLTPALYENLKSWITGHYREELRPADLADIKLLQESRAALDDLSSILGIENLNKYP